MRALWLADILTDAGLTIRPYPGWELRGLSDFDPRGVIWHHTVTPPTTADRVVDRILATRGSSTTPPPLANYSTNRDGSISIIASGTANHGGVGVWNGVSGNRHWFGDEAKNLGTAQREPWPQVQVESMRRATAAILTHLGRDYRWMCGHKEYATPAGRKVDPHSLNMTVERARVAELMIGDDMASPKDWDAADWAAFNRNVQAAVLTAPVGRSNPLTGNPPPWQIKDYLQRTFLWLKNTTPPAVASETVEALKDELND